MKMCHQIQIVNRRRGIEHTGFVGVCVLAGNMYTCVACSCDVCKASTTHLVAEGLSAEFVDLKVNFCL
jgi:hypothetical protein